MNWAVRQPEERNLQTAHKYSCPLSIEFCTCMILIVVQADPCGSCLNGKKLELLTTEICLISLTSFSKVWIQAKQSSVNTEHYVIISVYYPHTGLQLFHRTA